MTPEELSDEELRARFKALDSPLEPAREKPVIRDLTHKEDKSPPMWRALLQLRVLLPYLSRLVPLLDGLGHQGTPRSHEMQLGVAQVEADHQELRGKLQDQTVQIKRMEEQLERLRETTERNTLEQQELIEDLKSFRGTIKALAALGILLLLLNSGLLAYVLILIHQRR